MMKKRDYIIPILMLFISASIFAQKKRVKMSKDKIQTLKIAFITDKLDFTEDEAKKFWPIYNAHEKKTSELRAKEGSTLKKLLMNDKDANNLSEGDAKIAFETMSKIQDNAHQIRNEYHKKLKKILSYKKMIKLQITEREFRRYLFDKFKKRKSREKRE